MVYVLCQLLGSLAGLSILVAIVGRPCMTEAMEAGAKTSMSAGSYLLLNLVLTLMIVLVHLWAHEKAMFMGLPILVGFAYVTTTLVGAQMLSNDIPNFLRTFSLACFGIINRSHGLAALSCVGGAALATLIDVLVFEPRLWHDAVE